MLRVISDYSLWGLIEDSKNYKMILYADLKYREQITRILKLVDVELAYQISDGDEEGCCQIYDLLYENKDQIMVIVAKDNFSDAQKALTEVGFQLGVNFKNIEHYSNESNSLPYYYDPVLGYNLATREKDTAGFCIYGDEKKAGIRILTLGGSTSDAAIYPFKSWSEWLHEILEEKGISNVVMCGGVAGYSSSEELFKLIRDGFSLNPDIVLNYSGLNDRAVEKAYPYINFYMRQICDYLIGKKDARTLHFDNYSFGISYGINGFMSGCLEDKSRFWLENQKMIHAVCQVRNVQHICFFQPALFNGAKQLSERERSYRASLVYVGAGRESKPDYADGIRTFRKLVQPEIGKYEWMYDLSDIFNEDDIYIDMCHVNEKGNWVIASTIAEIMCRSIK